MVDYRKGFTEEDAPGVDHTTMMFHINTGLMREHAQIGLLVMINRNKC